MSMSADVRSFYSVLGKGVMQSPGPIICICLGLTLLGAGCSREEEPLPPVRDTRVVKPIKRPPPEEAETPPTREGLKAKSEEKKGEDVKTAAVPGKVSKELGAEASKEEIPTKEEAGYYIVKKGDSLTSIASREEVYGDPLKWPILCRLNMDELGDMEVGEDFVDRNLPEGMRLKIITSAEVVQNLERQANKVWVLNVLSTPNKREIIPAAMKLVREGYRVYITRAKAKGKDWMRLRVGFFEKKAEADAEGEKIEALLDLGEPWKTKAGKQELEDFGGY